MSERAVRAILLAILSLFGLLGVLYAVETPAWQVPDEPAHYNYVLHIVENGRLPILEVGDYPAEYLEEIKARRFPEGMSIEPVRYEAHQPPLYYVLVAGVYRVLAPLGVPMPLGMRLFSLALGLGALLCGYHVLRRGYPARPGIALGAVAFAATLPMHVAMTAAVNNDVLVELLLAVIALLVIHPLPGPWSFRRAAGLGALVGLALLAKMQALVGLGLVLVAYYRDATGGTWRPNHLSGAHLGRLALLLGAALAVTSPWLLRNASVYGLGDPLALARHDLVVRGQLTTAEFLAAQGVGGLLSAFATTTFRSFWGQFGWMGVPLDERIYLALGLVSALVGVGFGMYVGRVSRRAKDGGAVGAVGIVLVAWVLLSLMGYLWWNVRYVQHQGRYLFPAILPIGVAFTLGLGELLRRPLRLTLPLLGIPAAALSAWGAVRGDLPGTVLTLLVAAAGALSVGHWLARRWPGVVQAAWYGTMAAFSVAALYRIIVPGLSA